MDLLRIKNPNYSIYYLLVGGGGGGIDLIKQLIDKLKLVRRENELRFDI